MLVEGPNLRKQAALYNDITFPKMVASIIVEMLRPLFDTQLAHPSMVEQVSMASRLMFRTMSKGGEPCCVDDSRAEWLCRDCRTERQAAKQSHICALSPFVWFRLWLFVVLLWGGGGWRGVVCEAEAWFMGIMSSGLWKEFCRKYGFSFVVHGGLLGRWSGGLGRGEAGAAEKSNGFD